MSMAKVKEDCFYKNFPKAVVMEITNRCNLNCSYCSARKLIKNPTDISLEEIEVITARLKQQPFEFIALCGMGEPLVHKHFYEILEIMKDLKIVLVSNGSVPIDFDRLTETGNVHIITFSVDGVSQEILEKVCPGYNRSRLIQNLDNAREYGVNVSFNVTLSPDNIVELEDVVDLAVEYGVIFLSVGLPLGQEQWVKKNYKEIAAVLKRIEQKVTEVGLNYEDPFEKKCTLGGAPSALLLKNGDFYPCCDYYSRRPATGNLFQTDILSMWENNIYTDFRTGRFCFDCSRYHNRFDIKSLLMGEEK